MSPRPDGRPGKDPSPRSRCARSRLNILDVTLHADAIHRRRRADHPDVAPCHLRGHASCEAGPSGAEVYLVEIQVPEQAMGGIYGVLTRQAWPRLRGRPAPGTPSSYNNQGVFFPSTSILFGFRSATCARQPADRRSRGPCSITWQVLPGDVYDAGVPRSQVSSRASVSKEDIRSPTRQGMST